MNLEFQAIPAKEKDKNKNGTIRLQTSKTKYSDGAVSFVHFNLAVTQKYLKCHGLKKRHEFKWFEVPHAELNAVKTF